MILRRGALAPFSNRLGLKLLGAMLVMGRLDAYWAFCCCDAINTPMGVTITGGVFMSVS
jgi:hypothetical protein